MTAVTKRVNLSECSLDALKLLVANIPSLTDECLASYHYNMGDINAALVLALIREEQRKRREVK